ncbi:MAG: SDR family oxidoreductase [Nitrososphaerales archaeon]
MDLGLSDKVALVTAASKGIGYGTAKVLAKEGCKVCICSRTKEIEKAADSIKKETGNKNILALQADLTVEADIEKLITSIKSEYGDVQILAYNTGGPKIGSFLDLSNEDWEQGFNLLLMSAVWLTKRVVRPMRAAKWGRIVYITSTTLKQPIRSLVLSNVIRLSIAGLSKDLSSEFGPDGITSNLLMQGSILTERQVAITKDYAKRSGLSYENAEETRLAEIPARRFGTAEDVGNIVAFLCSKQASYVNGATLLVDGGLIKSVF